MSLLPTKTRIDRKLRATLDRTDMRESLLNVLRAEGVIGSLIVATCFWLIACGILAMRSSVVPYRLNQFVNHDIVARVAFTYPDEQSFDDAQDAARAAEPHVYKETRPVWDEVERSLLTLPERVKGKSLAEIQRSEIDLAKTLDNASLTRLQEYAADQTPRKEWDEAVRQFVSNLRGAGIVILSDDARKQEYARNLRLGPGGPLVSGETTLSPTLEAPLRARVEEAARGPLPPILMDKVVRLTMLQLTFGPTHELSESDTQRAQAVAAEKVPESAGWKQVQPNQRFVTAGTIKEADHLKLKYEHEAYRGQTDVREYLGLCGAALLITIALSAYVARYQKRIIRNHARAVALCVLLLSMLLLAQVAGVSTWPLYLLGVVPTILVAMTLAIAYEQRFALGISAMHAALVTLALDQPLSFFLVLLAGSATCSMTTSNLRSRMQLTNIGGLTGVVLMVATLVAGLLHGYPLSFAWVDAAFAGVSGMAVGFFVLGAMPFVESVFRISTGMSLLELADLSHPLLRKLSTEAPGTYQHSMQVSVIAEEACQAIGGNALLTRVGAYYHDVGKINKAEYFIENQSAGQQNRHMMLSPNVSMLIIVGHVKDGLQLAREYHLPTAIFPFIQSHHGTTLIEYFYHRAQQQEDAKSADPEEAPEVDEHQFRYPGPKPRSKEVAILMLADAAESACRTIDEPSAARIETLVHDIVIKRLLDGQFDECDMTMREIEIVERSMIRTLIGIYHARIAYPSNEEAEDTAETETSERKVASAG
jgi:hypothetical protein